MDAFLKSRYPEDTCRRLRSILLEFVADLGMETAVPNSFDVEELLRFAEKNLSRRDARDHRLYLELLARTGVALIRNGLGDRGRLLLERGRRVAKEPGLEARFDFLLVHNLLFPKNELEECRERLEIAFASSANQWRLKCEILLVLADVRRSSGDYLGADEAVAAVLQSSVLEYRPIAHFTQSILRAHQESLDEALALAKKAHRASKGSEQFLTERITRRNIASVLLARGESEEAQQILEGVREEELRLLDIRSLGITCNNLAAARGQSGDIDGALEAAIDSIRFHTASRHEIELISSYNNVGRALTHQGCVGAAHAAFDRAIRIAREMWSPIEEMRTILGLLEMIKERRLPSDSTRLLVERCQRIARTETRMPKALLQRAALSLGDLLLAVPALGAPSKRIRSDRLATSVDDAELDRRLGGTDPNYPALLDARLGTGLSGDRVPNPSDIRGFLLLFCGDYLRSRDYAQEFPLTPGRIQRHLRELSQEGILELHGVRKKAKYSLAFHRE